MSTTTKRTGMGVIVTAAVLVLLVITALVMSGDNKAEAVNTAKSSPTATPSDTEKCKDQFVQKLDKNTKFRFVSSGFKGTATEKREQLVTALGHDYRYLAFVAEQLFHENIEEKTLVNGDCLSTEGQDLYGNVRGALMAAGAKNGKASADSYNTGMEDGKAVVSKERGIRGDRSATIYTLIDGTEFVVLDRCGNMTLPSPPKGVPTGKTDNPPPPKNPPPTNPPPGNPGKDPSLDPAAQGNVPEQVKGKAPAPAPKYYQPTKPKDPPKKYTPPPAPKPKPPTGSKPTTQPSNPPATGSNDGNNGGTIDQPDW